MTQDVRRAFSVCAEALFGGGRVLIEVRRKVNHYVVIVESRRVVRAQDVEARAPRKIVRTKKTAHMHAEITAATCDDDSQFLDLKFQI